MHGEEEKERLERGGEEHTDEGKVTREESNQKQKGRWEKRGRN